MASSKVVIRLSFRLPAIASKLCRNSLLSELSSPKINSRASFFDSATRLGRTSRLPVELSSQESLMPLHSAIASARLRSSLTIESQSWGLVPQVPLHSEIIIGRYFLLPQSAIIKSWNWLKSTNFDYVQNKGKLTLFFLGQSQIALSPSRKYFNAFMTVAPSKQYIYVC